MDLRNSIDPNRLPKHIAIIMDGNGRWAKERGHDRVFGHHEGVISVREIVNASAELGIQYLTLYAFSAENWNRPKAEVDALMELLVNTIRKEVEELKKNNVRLHIIGDFASLPEICQKELNEAKDITAANTGLNLVLALSYSSRQEIAEAAKQVAMQVAQGKLKPEEVNCDTFQKFLYTANFPDPELMIRTSGEYRISNYLLYQLAYAELYFTNVHWPDFRKNNLYEALVNYQQRERRFGKTSEQIQTNSPSMYKGAIKYCFLILCVVYSNLSQAQIGGGGSGTGLNQFGQQGQGSSDAGKQKEYELAGITVSGAKYLDHDLLIAVTNLTVGQKLHLPNDENIAKAIKALWKQELFSNVDITITKYIDDKVFINIGVEERPRLSRFNFRNIKPGEAKELKTKLTLVSNKVVTDATKKEAIVRIKKFYTDKGFGRVQVSVLERNDSSSVNKVILTFVIDKGSKTHINDVNIVGEHNAAESRLKRTLKSTKEMTRITLHPDAAQSVYGVPKRSFKKYITSFGFLSPSRTLDALDPYFRFKLFTSSKFNQKKYDDDKQSLIAYYNTLGYRDASIVSDTTYPVKNGNINVDIRVKEGHKYYFGDISWKGNTKYSDEFLSKTLGIKRGDVYNQDLLEKRMGRQLSPDGGGEDVSSLYMDDGYLFFNIEPNEISVKDDTINFEMRITEGSQATIRDINIAGNERTNEHVIRRQLYTYPGNKFSRAELIRSQREIATLGFFDQEKIGILPKPHPEDGTVDIDYTVVEKSSDQLQLSAGFGGGVNFYGNVGITFNNFSIRNIFRPKFWDPLPVGDGQKFSISYASNGAYYNSLSSSFTEPWLGGHKPNALTANIVYSKYSAAAIGTDPNVSFLRMAGGGLSMGKRLNWPDNYFVFNYGLFYNNYRLKQYALVPNFTDGFSNDLHFKFVLSRNSIDRPLYPMSGSNVSFTFQVTPPYSAFTGRDYTNLSSDQKYKWIEYHKYKFSADFYQRIYGKLVLRMASKYGFLGYYNKGIGFSPFERFQVGGDGLSGYSYFVGKDIISQRGYEVYADAATIYNKYTTEIRYPFSLSATATIYGLAFVDAANAWDNFSEYNPFKLNRDVGVGIRIFLPMFGLLGLDYGIGIDRYDPATGTTGFKDIGKFNFMLGFEPE